MQAQLKLVFAAVLASAALSACATDAHHPADAKTPAVETNAPANPGADQAVAEQMQKLQAARDKTAAAKTPAERRIAMQEGMLAMRDAMAMMRDMHAGNGCMNMGMGMSGGKDGGMGMGMSGSKDGGMSGGMGMMDMMMQMMDQQSSMMKMPMGQ